MNLNFWDKKKQQLLQAARICGSQQAIADQIGSSRFRYNKWLNGEENVPLYYAIIIQSITKGVVRVKNIVDRKYNKAIETIEMWSAKAEKESNYYVLINSIEVAENKPFNGVDVSDYYLSRPVILDDTDSEYFNLAAGFRSYFIHKVYDRTKIQAKVFNLSNILNTKLEQLKFMMYFDNFLISEKIELVDYLCQTIGNRKGKRTDLQHSDNYRQVNFKGRTSVFISKNIGLGSEFLYRQARQVMNKGAGILIEAMDRKIISISKAASMISFSPEIQREVIKTKIEDLDEQTYGDFINHWQLWR